MRLQQTAEDVGRMLDVILASAQLPLRNFRPQRLLDAMRHGALNGGKRLRPFLVDPKAPPCLARPETTSCAQHALLSWGSIVIRSYTTIFRRWTTTICAVTHGAQGLRRGDRDLRPGTGRRPPLRHGRPCDPSEGAVRAWARPELAAAAGPGGMAGGQTLDLVAETAHAPEHSAVRRLQAMKTRADSLRLRSGVLGRLAVKRPPHVC